MSIRDHIDQIADKVLDLWDSSDHWTQGTLAKNEVGQDVSPQSSDAIKWCAVGVFRRAAHELDLYQDNDEIETFLNNCVRSYTNGECNSMIRFNDETGRSFEDVRLFVKCLRDLDSPSYDHCPCPDCQYDFESNCDF